MKILDQVGTAFKIAALIVGLLTPAAGFYVASRVTAAQHEIRLTNAEKRLDRLEEIVSNVPKLIEDKFEKIGLRFDKQGETLQNVEKSIVRLQEQLINVRR